MLRSLVEVTMVVQVKVELTDEQRRAWRRAANRAGMVTRDEVRQWVLAEVGRQISQAPAAPTPRAPRTEPAALVKRASEVDIKQQVTDKARVTQAFPMTGGAVAYTSLRCRTCGDRILYRTGISTWEDMLAVVQSHECAGAHREVR
jgi:hypothetical protein